MCGIAGFWHHEDRPADRDEAGRMIDRILHRGPDEQGIYTDNALALGHVRLSIIDLAEGQQPMHLPERGLTIVFNGEIFNYLEIRAELEAKGHRFRTHSDTEVILHAYAEYGENCLTHFNGQWGFAIWDKPNQQLFMARDRVGIRPLFYTATKERFAFASEIKALFALPEVNRAIDPKGLAETFVFWHPLPPHTAFQGIKQLPPGHAMVLQQGVRQPRIWRWWDADFTPGTLKGSDEDLIAELRYLLADATRIMLRADVPVGAYLSGGLDSSVTCGLIAHAKSAALRTFSVAFADKDYDESGFQQAVATRLGTSHASVLCSGQDISRNFSRVIWHTEQPLLRTAPTPLLLLSQMVREQGFKVVLTGEGADEVLGGYDIFKEAKIRRFWGMEPNSRLRPLALRRLYPYMESIRTQPLPYLKAFFHAEPEALKSPLFSHLPRWELGQKNLIFLAEHHRQALADWDPIAAISAALPEAFESWTWLGRAQYLELTTLLPGYILCAQGDRMALAHAIEGRFPFLDARVVDFGARLPDRLKIKGLNEKYILKKAAHDLVPAEVLARTKQPYRAPDARSFTGKEMPEAEIVEQAMSEKALAETGLFNPQAAGLLLKKARAGGLQSTRDNMAFIGILSSQILARHFTRSSDIDTPQ